jgi:carboxylesterase
VRRAEFAALIAAASIVAGNRPRIAAAAAEQAPSFRDAVAGIEATISRDRSGTLIERLGVPRLYHHGKPTSNAVLLFHGFTNCPQQFEELALRFYNRGCNVYVPRIPLHGYRNRLTHALENLDAPLLESATLKSYRLTRGLGTRISVVGLSLGGLMAMYLAQTQPIDLAVPIAPFLMPIGVPERIGLAATKLATNLPDQYIWWDPRIKAACLPTYAYPGFPSRALAECILFGNGVLRAAKAKQPPLARNCTLVLNKSESAVNNTVALGVLDAWKSAGAPYKNIVLDDLGKPVHDIIDPTTFPQARTLVYPKLESIVLGA